MATFFIDIDGTIVEWGTAKPLEGAVETLTALHKAGHKLIFTTKREALSVRFDNNALLILLKQIVEEPVILWDLDSPRIVINDDGVGAICHVPDGPWTLPIEEMLAQVKT